MYKSLTPLVLFCFVASLMLAGCAGKTTSIGVSPEKLGMIGAKINSNPDRMQSILSSYNLTESEFRKAIREVSSDPDMSERYHEAFRRHS